jgi:hypothetical protein
MSVAGDRGRTGDVKEARARLKVRDVMRADPTTLKRNDKLTLADDIIDLVLRKRNWQITSSGLMLRAWIDRAEPQSLAAASITSSASRRSTSMDSKPASLKTRTQPDTGMRSPIKCESREPKSFVWS